MGIDRRQFAKGAVAAPAVLAFAGKAVAQPTPEVPPAALPNTLTAVRQIVKRFSGAPFAQPLMFDRADAAPALKPFALSQVRLGEGPFLDAHRANAGYLKRLSPDRLLHSFRLNAGISSHAEALGGWEAPDGELRGHFMGHYLSACALGFASTGDTELKQRGDLLVAGLAECQTRLNQGGYLSAYPAGFYDRLQKGEQVWAPFYTMHKLLAGLHDMHVLAGNARALMVLTALCGWVDDWTGRWDESHMQRILDVEFGGMQEQLYNLAALTGDARWGRVGDRFTKKAVFNPLASASDQLAGLHMNTHIPQVIGAARRYEITSDYRFRDVARFFWQTVAGNRSYATGGASNREHWLATPSRLSDEFISGDQHQECCCSYNMMKLTRHLFGWQPDERYIGYYERNLFNHRLGTIRPDGMNQYFVSLTPGAWRTWGEETTTFWCCNGSAAEEYNKLSDTIYFNDGRDLWVNLLLASRLDWPERGLRLSQQTRFPDEGRTRITVEKAPTQSLAINLRIPAWTTKDARVLLNGKPLDSAPVPGSYYRIDRQWKDGDTLVLDVPMVLRVEAFADQPSLAAVLYGPLVLAGEFPRGDAAEPVAPPGKDKPHGPDVYHHAISIPSLAVKGKAPDEWLTRDGALSWRVRGHDIVLRPFNRVQDKRYTVYWQTV